MAGRCADLRRRQAGPSRRWIPNDRALAARIRTNALFSPATPRSGQIAAMAQDILDFAGALGIDRFRIVGHDWGARIAYFLASIAPARVERIVTLSAGWDPGPWKTPGLAQAKNFWYQWFMATERGADIVRRDPVAFARFQWTTWSPPEWFDESAFAATSRSFDNPDWVAITLHSYRVRWDEAESDPRYADLERRQQAVRTIAVPTLLIHGQRGSMRLGVDIRREGAALQRRVRASRDSWHRPFPHTRSTGHGCCVDSRFLEGTA